MREFLLDRLPAASRSPSGWRPASSSTGPDAPGPATSPTGRTRSCGSTGRCARAGRPVRRRGAVRRRPSRRRRQTALPGHDPARGARARVRAGPVARLFGLPDLAAAHRLDRLTAGVLLLTCDRRHRAAYARLFQEGGVTKTYEALAPFDPAGVPADCDEPHREATRQPAGRVVTGEPNSETLVELVETRGRYARYRLTPATGKTHQLRLHLAALGLPIVGDPLYPGVAGRRRRRLQHPAAAGGTPAPLHRPGRRSPARLHQSVRPRLARRAPFSRLVCGFDREYPVKSTGLRRGNESAPRASRRKPSPAPARHEPSQRGRGLARR